STRKDILQTITRLIGAIAKPDIIQFVSDLPKTRSGKIMRRILRKIAEGEIDNLGDTSTLQDPTVVESIIKGAAAMKEQRYSNHEIKPLPKYDGLSYNFKKPPE